MQWFFSKLLGFAALGQPGACCPERCGRAPPWSAAPSRTSSWRGKSKFAAGSGLGGHLADFAEREIGDAEFARRQDIHDGVLLRFKEELLYYDIFKQIYPRDDLLPPGRYAHVQLVDPDAGPLAALPAIDATQADVAAVAAAGT
jgi:hypothetical protein